MKAIYIKELKQFFNNLTGIIAVGIFLLVMGLLLFLFPDTNLLEYGFASLEFFFNIAPFVMIQLVGAVTMRLFADEFKSGTYELLATKPLPLSSIILGKYAAALTIVTLSLLPTLVYAYTLHHLSLSDTGLDWGAVIGSYLGLIFLAGAFVSMGIFASSLSANSVVALLLSCLMAYMLYDGIIQVSKLTFLSYEKAYWLEWFSLHFHYLSISKGVLVLSDGIYFLSVTAFFIYLTAYRLRRYA